MYFSRISLQKDAIKSRDFWRVATGPYQVHTMIWDLFADSDDRDRDFLYRIDIDHGKPRIFVVSAREPIYTGGVWLVETKPYKPVIAEGQHLAFSLRANPVRTKTIPEATGQKKKRFRHDVVMDAKTRLREEHGKDMDLPPLSDIVQQEGFRWLSSRGDLLGFSVEEGNVRAEGYRKMNFLQGKKNRSVSISIIDFTGLLTVNDHDRFIKTLGTGIGPAKGFGCGLMLIKPV